jgi:hypothetical protein
VQGSPPGDDPDPSDARGRLMVGRPADPGVIQSRRFEMDKKAKTPKKPKQPKSDKKK